MSSVKCQACGGEMQYGVRARSNLLLQVVGVFLFLVALGFCLTIVGAIIGIPLMIVAGRLGFKKEKGWVCPSCGNFFAAEVQGIRAAKLATVHE